MRPPFLIRILSLLIGIVLFSASGKAALCAIPLSSSQFTASLDTGAAIVDEDLFIPAIIELGFAANSFELTLQGPFRFRVLDNTPKDAGTLRKQDWDERSDWARIVRDLQFRKDFADGALRFHAGELNGVYQGYGEIVGHYFNSTDMDHYHGGLEAAVEIRSNGLELLINDVLAPSIFVGRIYLAPIAWFSKRQIARRFHIGAWLFVDKGVPSRTLGRRDTGLVAAGMNTGLTLVQSKRGSLETYMSVGAMDGDAGFHAGFNSNVILSAPKKRGLFFHAEFRYAGEDYYPALVNPFYDHNRRFFTRDSVTGELNTFTDHLANTAMNVQKAAGFMADLELRFNHVFHLGARYDYMSKKRPHWLLFRVELVPSKDIAITVFYAAQDIEGGPRIFSLDALMGVAYHHRLVGPLRIYSEFCRRFRRITNDEVSFANETELGLGVMFSI